MDLPQDEPLELPDGVSHHKSPQMMGQRQKVEGGAWARPLLYHHHPFAVAFPQDAAARPPSNTGRPCVSPKEGAPNPPQPPLAVPQPGAEPGAAEDEEDAEDTVDVEEQELPAQPRGDAREEEGPRAEPQGAAEEAEEGRGRRKIILTPLEKLKLSTLNLLTTEAEPEPPPKPARLRLQAAPEALPGLWQGRGVWEDDEDEEVAMEEEGKWLQAGVSG